MQQHVSQFQFLHLADKYIFLRHEDVQMRDRAFTGYFLNKRTFLCNIMHFIRKLYSSSTLLQAVWKCTWTSVCLHWIVVKSVQPGESQQQWSAIARIRLVPFHYLLLHLRGNQVTYRNTYQPNMIYTIKQ